MMSSKPDTFEENSVNLKIETIKEEEIMCRVCMNVADIHISRIIFDELSICNAITIITNVEVTLEDQYSKHVCHACVNDLLVALNFKKKCESTNEILRKSAESCTTTNLVLPQSECDTVVHEVPIKRRRCRTKFEFEDDSSFDNEPLSTFEVSKAEKNTKRTKGVKKEQTDTEIKKARKPRIKKQEDESNCKDKRIYYYCRECKLKFETKDELKEHRSKRTCIRRSCPTCGKAVYDVAKHIQIVHMGALKGTCHICGKITSTPSALQNHLRTHSDKLAYSCQHCPYKGKAKAYLVLHMRTHTGEKPYLCSECPLSFTSASNLKKHQRIHNEKPLECSKCGKKFHLQKTLQEHIDSVHLNIRYQCTQCDRELFTRRKLLRHELRVHKREKHKINDSFRKVIASDMNK